MSEIKKLRNVLAPPLDGERRANVVKYAECVAEYSEGTYDDQLVWQPACKRGCEHCPYAMTHKAYIQAMTDNAMRQ